MFRSYDAIVGVASHDWIHQLGEEAVSSGISQGTKEEILRYQPGYQGEDTQVSAGIPRRRYSVQLRIPKRSARIPKRRNAGTSQDTHVSGRILRYQPGYQGGDTQVSLGMSQDTIGRKYV